MVWWQLVYTDYSSPECLWEGNVCPVQSAGLAMQETRDGEQPCKQVYLISISAEQTCVGNFNSHNKSYNHLTSLSNRWKLSSLVTLSFRCYCITICLAYSTFIYHLAVCLIHYHIWINQSEKQGRHSTAVITIDAPWQAVSYRQS